MHQEVFQYYSESWEGYYGRRIYIYLSLIFVQLLDSNRILIKLY